MLQFPRNFPQFSRNFPAFFPQFFAIAFDPPPPRPQSPPPPRVRGHLMYCHLGRRRIGQDGRMFAHVLYPRSCSLGGILAGGKSQCIPGKLAVTRRKSGARRRYSLFGCHDWSSRQHLSGHKLLLTLFCHCLGFFSLRKQAADPVTSLSGVNPV